MKKPLVEMSRATFVCDAHHASTARSDLPRGVLLQNNGTRSIIASIRPRAWG
jgi:hypothetical protein